MITTSEQAKHDELCPAKIVQCSAERCSWKGPRDQRGEHERVCMLFLMGPELKTINKRTRRLERNLKRDKEEKGSEIAKLNADIADIQESVNQVVSSLEQQTAALRKEVKELKRALTSQVSPEVAEPKVRKRKREKKKDPNAPKKARSSYIYFCADRREAMQKKFPDDKMTDIHRRLGSEWRNLSVEEKKVGVSVY